ncbi:short chain enoyl-CoA hydratase /3-hydroxyacyl-CoA dehydrogenase [Stella humosa]|uniref:Short chain enoyl-CoA hydratase /3-hydroxyacyl-CoA dehydrogenase n=1 Tax=Stella humosa TaxID=94 RepID=A0A3N1KTA6_9PROT|nr:3-hydroxyacyl-CoA dehydrogenase NAD-binding domain-containing protein [Stella humosa]ROP83224.1 short chain enoyl-CoA hydratase /3-hydroxyacyl-CoA dehydrogenase [Stella humosa]BBK29995.1 3-hydroxyacyl-CoA dehydrogenase [Stella humosa]
MAEAADRTPPLVRTDRDGDIARITVANPPVNALSHAVRSGILAAVQAADADAGVAAIVLRCDGRTFVAGADITEFGRPAQEPILSTVLAAIDASSKPVVAAIHGTALGGGLELALACHWRVAVQSARVGLPEVKLGIIPGGGGTQRLPRAAGVAKALDMITSGEMIGADAALAAGIIDQVVAGDLDRAAVELARAKAAEGAMPRLRDRDERTAEARGQSGLFDAARAAMARRARGRTAPEYAIRAVQAAVELPFDEGIAYERALCDELKASAQSRAQRHIFFAERDAAKVPGVGRDTPVARIGQAAVIGAGTMGGGIAMCLASAGIPVTLIETTQPALDRGLATIRSNYEATARRGGMAAADVETRMGLIRPSLAMADLAGADLVIEAVFEDTAIKKAVFAEIDRHAKAGAVLATNTSTLDVNAIAAATGRPESVVGLHFFSPANVMKLLEIVRGARTDAGVLATSLALAKRIGKVPVVVGVCDGFVGNRMLRARGRQAERLVMEGALPQQVDAALYDFGFPMGPYAMGDLAGLDIGWRIRQEKGLKSAVADRLCALGRFGQKTGAGWFRYEAGSRTPIPDPAVEAIILEEAARAGIARREIANAEILDRLLLPMVNEGARILEEGMALRPGDIDIVWVYGYGWPIQEGGPMHWADARGLAAARDRMVELARQHGEDFVPAPLIERLAAEGKGFADLPQPA